MRTRIVATIACVLFTLSLFTPILKSQQFQGDGCDHLRITAANRYDDVVKARRALSNAGSYFDSVRSASGRGALYGGAGGAAGGILGGPATMAAGFVFGYAAGGTIGAIDGAISHRNKLKRLKEALAHANSEWQAAKEAVKRCEANSSGSGGSY